MNQAACEQDFALATALADAYRRADNEDRLVYPAEVLSLLAVFLKLWPHYRHAVWPSLHDQIAISLQPGIQASYEDPQEAAEAMAHLMAKLEPEFDVLATDPVALLRYARRVRAFTSNVSGCARAVARVLHALAQLRQPPSSLYRRLPHYFLVVRPLRRYDGLLSGFESDFRPSLQTIEAGERPVIQS
jgi:hypothetical protein